MKGKPSTERAPASALSHPPRSTQFTQAQRDQIARAKAAQKKRKKINDHIGAVERFTDSAKQLVSVLTAKHAQDKANLVAEVAQLKQQNESLVKANEELSEQFEKARQ